jgi:hypothetical protein
VSNAIRQPRPYAHLKIRQFLRHLRQTMKRTAAPVFAFSLFLAAASSTSVLYAQIGGPRADGGRQAIKAKIAIIRLNEFQADNLPLGEVIKNLKEEVKCRDPERRGINFLLNPNFQDAIPESNQPGATTKSEPVDIAALPIKVPPLSDISVEAALQVIVATAGPPRLKYRIEDYAVVIYPTTETKPLLTRTFKVDPNIFQQGLQGVVGVPVGSAGGSVGNSGGGQVGQNAGLVTVPRVQVAPVAQGGVGGISGVTRTNGADNIQSSVRTFIQALGVDMSPPKTAVFNDRQGTLMVRATRADLELIEAALGR